MASRFQVTAIITFTVGVHLLGGALALGIEQSSTTVNKYCHTCAATQKVAEAKPVTTTPSVKNQGFTPPNNGAPKNTRGSGSR